MMGMGLDPAAIVAGNLDARKVGCRKLRKAGPCSRKKLTIRPPSRRRRAASRRGMNVALQLDPRLWLIEQGLTAVSGGARSWCRPLLIRPTSTGRRKRGFSGRVEHFWRAHGRRPSEDIGLGPPRPAARRLIWAGDNRRTGPFDRRRGAFPHGVIEYPPRAEGRTRRLALHTGSSATRSADLPVSCPSRCGV